MDCLRAFNRKERYWVIKTALGDSLPLSGEFRHRLSSKLPISIPPDAWWAVDYHIDWLVGAIALYSHSGGDLPSETNDARIVRANQEDFDFIVAFDRTIILIEAKYEGAWSTPQIESKCERLAQIVGWADGRAHDLELYFGLMSPKEYRDRTGLALPSKVNKGEPPFWIKLERPSNGFHLVQRHDGRMPSAAGTMWKVSERK